MTVAFDVDGTLVDGDAQSLEDVRSLLILLKRMDCKIVVWSGGGTDYAAMMARRIHVDRFVDEYRAKAQYGGPDLPDITFDDEDVTLGRVNVRIP